MLSLHAIECFSYVDFLIYYRYKYIHIIERHLQRSNVPRKLSDWADSNGFKFSTSKTVFMHFCKLIFFLRVYACVFVCFFLYEILIYLFIAFIIIVDGELVMMRSSGIL